VGKAARQRDDQAPRRRFGGTQQPEHGAVKMARQRPSRLAFGSHLRMRAQRVAAAMRNKARAGGHGDERGHDALQRLAVFLDRCVPVDLRP
jgi:hypothetical protein